MIAPFVMLAYRTRYGLARYIGGTRPAQYQLGTQRLSHSAVLALTRTEDTGLRTEEGLSQAGLVANDTTRSPQSSALSPGMSSVLIARTGGATMQPTRQAGDQHYSHRTPEKVKRGPDAPGAKLSAAQIAEICAAFDGGSSQSHLARTYGVSRVTIWRHITARAEFQM